MSLTGKKFLKLAGIDLRQIDDIPRLYIFWPGGDVDDYGPEDVTNRSFGRHLEAREATPGHGRYCPRRTGILP